MIKIDARIAFLLGLLFLVNGCQSPRPVEVKSEIRTPASDLPPEMNSPESIPTESEITLIPTRGVFDWPVDRARLSRGYSLKPVGRRHKPHLGIDLAAAKGTNIYAAQDGLVIYAGQAFKGYGKMIMIEGSSDFASLYGHLFKIKVKTGQKVKKGQIIGAMGRTGRASGVHLHFEVRKNKKAVDPLLYLPQTSVTVMRGLASELPDE